MIERIGNLHRTDYGPECVVAILVTGRHGGHRVRPTPCWVDGIARRWSGSFLLSTVIAADLDSRCDLGRDALGLGTCRRCPWGATGGELLSPSRGPVRRFGVVDYRVPRTEGDPPMTSAANSDVPVEAPLNRRLAILLAMAMFVLVVDTSLMNVSIAAVVHDLDTTVSGVQSAIALEALVSAAFILIGSKVGDLIGRKKAYVLGLLGYAVGATAMTLAQGLTAIIIFWAIIGGLGASLLLPAMQSLIHGNFQGAAQKKVYALVGAAAAIAAAVGPLLGGFITTYLSWRVGFAARSGGHRGRAVRHQTRQGRALHRTTPGRRRRRGAVRAGHGRHRARHPGVAGGRRSGRGPAGDRRGRDGRVRLLAGAPQTAAQGDADRPGPVQVQGLPVRHHRADAAADRAGRHHDRAADLPADGAGIQRHAGGSIACPALADDVRRRDAGREEGREAAAGRHHPVGLRAAHGRVGGADSDRAAGGFRVVPARPAGHCGVGAGAAWCRS